MVTDDLDRRSKRVLEAIYQYGGEAEMSEIKEYTGIEKNGIVLYRLNEKLGPAGLVETRKVDGEEGNLGVTVATLTESGKSAVGRVLDDEEAGPTLAEEVQMLRGEVEELSDAVDMNEGRIHAAEERAETIDDVEARLASIEERFEAVEEVAADVEELRDDLDGRIEDAVDDHMSRREFLGRDVATALHEAGLIEPTEHNPRGDDQPGQPFDKRGGRFTGVSDRLLRPTGPLRELIEESGSGSELFPEGGRR